MNLPSIFLASALALTFAGCTSSKEEVSTNRALLSDESGAITDKLQSRKTQPIGWAEALDRTLRDNQSLREARAMILTADDGIDRVWLDLLPGVSLTASMQKDLTHLSSGSNQPDISLFAFFNIGGVVGTRMRYYAATLSLIRTRYAYEVMVREKTMALYQVFRERERLDERKAWAKHTNRVNRAGWSPLNGSNSALDEYLSAWSIEQAETALQTEVSALIGSQDALWIPASKDLPKLEYQVATPDIKDSAKAGGLSLKVMATELEGARLRSLGATLAFWPDLAIGISGPPLYHNGPGGTSFFDPNGAKVNFSANIPIDSQLSAVYALRETDRQVALMRERMVTENTRRIEKLMITKRALEIQATQVRSVERRFTILRTTPAPTNYAQYGVWATELRTLLEQRSRLQAERDNLQSLFWFMDEARWPDPNPEQYADADKARKEAVLKALEEDRDKIEKRDDAA